MDREMINSRALQLLDKKGFIDAYYDGIRSGMSCINAFNEINDEYHSFFGKFKYSDYDSFRKVRDHKKL